ncbi:MAG: type II/IV secretion system protein, partial [Thermotogota bacterium]|nr:type II/IV secretion system protein [Thermotogota bacterium]
MIKSNLGKILQNEGLINEKQLEKATKLQKDTGNDLVDILVNDIGIESGKIYEILADLYGIRKINVNLNKLDKARIKNIKNILSNFDENFKDKLLENTILPYQR